MKVRIDYTLKRKKRTAWIEGGAYSIVQFIASHEGAHLTHFHVEDPPKGTVKMKLKCGIAYWQEKLP